MFLFGGKIDKAAEMAINSESEKLFTDFHKIFTQAYINEISNASKELSGSHAISDTSSSTATNINYSLKYMMKGLLLSQAPVRNLPIAEGQISKQGGSILSWKKRHFIVLNEKDNYKIEYYEGKGGKLKGEIDGAGYSVVPFQQSDIEQYGPNGLKLVPYQSIRRTWYLRFDNEKMLTEWTSILQNAVFKAGPKINPNPAVATAFQFAFELLQSRYNMTEYSRAYGSEVDQLEDLLYMMLEDKGVKRSEKIEKIVRPATEAGWHTVCTNATSRTVAYRESFHTHMELIAQHEKSIRDQILGKIGPTLESFLAQKQITALKPIMETLMDPLTQAFGEAVRSFFTILSTKSLVKDLDGREKRTGTFASLVYGLEYHLQSDSLLFWSSQILNNMFSDPFTISIFLKSKYPYLIVARECIDTVGSVLYRALNTYEVALNDAIEHPHTAYISRLLTVISQLVHDSKRLLRGIAHKIMHSILRSYILAQLPQYQTEVADLNFTQGIPPELQLYFDSERMLLNTVFEFTDKFVTDFLTPFFMDCDTSIDGIEKELIALGNNEPSTNVNRASVNRLSTKHMSLSATRQPSTGTSSATATRLLTPDVIQTPDLGRSSFEQRNNKPLRTSGGALRTSLKSSNTPSPMSSPVSPHKSAIGVALPGLSIRPPLSPVGRVVEDSVGKIDSQGGEAVSIEKKEKTTNELMEENAKALSDLAL